MDDGSPEEERRTSDASPRPTLGRQLDAQARARIAGYVPGLAWARPFAVLARRVEQLAELSGERFERVEQRPHTDIAARDRWSSVGATQQPAGRVARPVERAPEYGEGRQEESEVREVPSSVRSRLRGLVGPAADAMEVHVGPDADAVARAADADAVTIGRDVHVRQDRYAPQREDGIALLTHEATHVAALLDPGSGWRRAVGTDAEERLARDHERHVLGGSADEPTRPGSGRARRDDARRTDSGTQPAGGAYRAGAATGTAPVSIAAAGPGAPRQSAAMPGAAVHATAPQAARAATDRDLDGPPAVDLESLRRGVVADVMRQIMSEYERGG
ncbi:DUF4157 domain-containing protein [Kribbella sp. NPDC058693]|uniref:eCIS core domain-containing protein n=1 Tax=Kribbella sp. NPDC058693 TaxID=3346602 RepID=UPI00364952A0